METNPNKTPLLQSIEAVDRLIKKSKPLTSTCMKSAVVALFTGDRDNQLRYSGIIGMLHLDNDRELKSQLFRLYDMESIAIVLEVQMYYGFDENYRMVTDTLYAFDYFTEGIIAFKFYSEVDANIMHLKVKSAAPHIEDFRKHQKEQVAQQIKRKKESGIWGSIKKRTKGLFYHEQQRVVESSEIISVEKGKSIKFNIQTGQFNFQNLPPEWEQIFLMMNVGKQELAQDKNLARFIFEQAIIHQTRKEMIQNPSQQLKLCLDAIDQQGSIIEQYVTQKEESQLGKLPPPPPINITLPTIPSTLPPTNLGMKVQDGRGRVDLMNQIKNNNLKLKPVKTTEKGYQIDASSMNREERMDLAQHLRLKLQRRKDALNRRKPSDDQSD